MILLNEFIIGEEIASQYLDVGIGTVLYDELGRPDVRRIVVNSTDPLLNRIGHLERKLKNGFYLSWFMSFRCTKKELNEAEMLGVWIQRMFEPSGIECGTEYDYSDICPSCGAGGRQLSDLILDLRRTPKTKDIARTLSEEMVVSQRLAELIVDEGISGCELRPVMHKAYHMDASVNLSRVPSGRELLRQSRAADIEPYSQAFGVWLNRAEQHELCERSRLENCELLAKRARKAAPPAPWYQLVITAPAILAVPPTRFGIDPFNEDKKGEYRCSSGNPRGHLAGLSRLSELHLSRAECHGTDIACTANLIGLRSDLCRPNPLILISPRFYKLIKEHDIKGFSFEVAYLE